MKIKKQIKNTILSKVDLIAGMAGYKRPKESYQDKRFPEDQYSLIKQHESYGTLKNSLEIGCNKGKLVQLLANDGLFSVGLDLSPHWEMSNTGKAVLGAFPLTDSNTNNLPSFDSVLLLSVHHQWVLSFGDDVALKMIGGLFAKASKVMFIEFAAIADKYGYDRNSRFKENDEASVVEYATQWLSAGSLNCRVEYLGKTRELPVKEPYRFLFAIQKND